ncbi:MAG: hypothetical protein AAF514_09355 [Verrucomicrobiota bacterium]
MRSLSPAVFLATFIGCLPVCLFGDERPVVVPSKPTLDWYSELDEALAASRKSGKPVLLEFR